MRKVKIKLNYDELDCILKLLNDQVITRYSHKSIAKLTDNLTVSIFVVGHIAEIYAKQFPKTCFAYTGVKTVSLTPLQAIAVLYVIQNGWLTSDNQWTRTLLQINHDRIHKQLAA